MILLVIFASITTSLSLKQMVIGHLDADFLEDIDGKLREYVLEELNVQLISSPVH